MPKGKTVGVAPKASYGDYTSESLSVVEMDLDQALMGPEASFKAAASLEEGVAGRLGIDTDYENYSESTVKAPRSGADAPVCVNGYRFPHRRT